MNYPIMMDKIDYLWMKIGEEIHWNTDNSIEDLVNGDYGFGYVTTCFFKADKEVKW